MNYLKYIFVFVFQKIIIPKGLYCYRIIDVIDDKSTNEIKLKTKMCFFWDKDLPGCKLLNLSAEEDFLLWDSCKACSFNLGNF